MLHANELAVGGNDQNIELVNLAELGRFGVGGSRHAGKLVVHAEIVLEGNRGERLGLYSNPELDEKIISLGTEDDIAERDATIAEIWEVVKADRVLLPIHNQVLAYAMREGVTLPVQPENQPNMTTVTFE
jgi:ABC-type transport system substrate-binding protein